MTSSTAPLVTVVVPVYKVEEFLDQCVESIVRQTYKNLEIILVDDGSPDECPNMCDKWALKDSRINVIHQVNRGLSAARNSGIDQSHGEYILFVDSDDWVEPNLVEHCMDLLFHEQAEVVVYQYRLVSQNGRNYSNSRDYELFPKENVLSAADALEAIISMKLPNYAWSYIAKSDLLKGKITFPEGKVMEDIATTYLIWGSANRVALLHEQLYNYRTRVGSILSNKNLIFVHDCMEHLELFVQYFRERYEYLYPAAVNMYIQYLISFTFLIYRQKSQYHVSQYRSEFSNIERMISKQISNIGIRRLSKINCVKLILLKLHLLPVLVVVSECRNRRP